MSRVQNSSCSGVVGAVDGDGGGHTFAGFHFQLSKKISGSISVALSFRQPEILWRLTVDCGAGRVRSQKTSVARRQLGERRTLPMDRWAAARRIFRRSFTARSHGFGGRHQILQLIPHCSMDRCLEGGRSVNAVSVGRGDSRLLRVLDCAAAPCRGEILGGEEIPLFFPSISRLLQRCHHFRVLGGR